VSILSGKIFFKEQFGLLNYLGVFICLAGIVMVTLCASSVGEYFVFGVILLIIAILSEVGHATITKSLSGDYKPNVIVMYQFLIGSIYLLPLFITRGISNFDSSIYLSWKVFGPIFYLAILCSSIAFTLWVNSIKVLGVAKSGIFLAMIPVVTALFCFFMGKETLTLLQWSGIAISVLGVILSQVYCSKSKAN